MASDTQCASTGISLDSPGCSCLKMSTSSTRHLVSDSVERKSMQVANLRRADFEMLVDDSDGGPRNGSVSIDKWDSVGDGLKGERETIVVGEYM